jgi:DNA-binding transcriptional LysR family regulator
MDGRRDVSLDVLRTFQTVYQAGTVTLAAQLLGLSQPSVTAQLAGLERAVGQRLFERHRRGVTPTLAASDLARRLSGPLDDLADVARDLGVSRSVEGRTLRLGAPAELTELRIVPALAETVSAGVAVRTRLGLAGELLDALSTNELDLVVSTERPRGKLLISEPLFDEEFALVGAPQLAARLDTEAMVMAPGRAVATLPLLAYAEQLPIIRRWWRHVFGIPPPRRAALVVPDLRALRVAAVAGMGISVLPTYLCGDDLAADRLVRLVDTEDPPINTVFLAMRRSSRHEPHLAFVREQLLSSARDW